MASFVLTDAHVEVNSVDLSGFANQVTVNYEAEAQDDTVFGDSTRSNAGGLKVWSMDIQFFADEAASSVAQTVFPLVGSTTTVLVRPTSAAVGTTNPNYTGTGLVQSFPPLQGSVGEMAASPLAVVSAGDLSRATS